MVSYQHLTADERHNMAVAALHAAEREHYRLAVADEAHPNLEQHEERVKRLQDEVNKLEREPNAEG